MACAIHGAQQCAVSCHGRIIEHPPADNGDDARDVAAHLGEFDTGALTGTASPLDRALSDAADADPVLQRLRAEQAGLRHLLAAEHAAGLLQGLEGIFHGVPREAIEEAHVHVLDVVDLLFPADVKPAINAVLGRVIARVFDGLVQLAASEPPTEPPIE